MPFSLGTAHDPVVIGNSPERNVGGRGFGAIYDGAILMGTRAGFREFPLSG